MNKGPKFEITCIHRRITLKRGAHYYLKAKILNFADKSVQNILALQRFLVFQQDRRGIR